MQLRGVALEEAAAAAEEERVADEEDGAAAEAFDGLRLPAVSPAHDLVDGRVERVADVAARVGAHVEDAEGQAERGDRLPDHRLTDDLGDARLVVRGADDLTARGLDEPLVAADVIVVVVGVEDRLQRELLALEGLEHRLGVGRVDDEAVAAVLQQPDVVVGAGGELEEAEHGGDMPA